jgi:uncharacterized membrane protein HdeD (DUF308 family)
MTTMRKELGRLSDTLLWRGVAFTMLGVAALIWPEPILVGALLTVALLAALLGLYEMTIAASIRRRTSRWWLVLAHGVLSLGFGLLTVGASALSFRFGSPWSWLAHRLRRCRVERGGDHEAGAKIRVASSGAE